MRLFLKSAIQRFRETSTPSGVLAVSIQLLIFYWALDLSGAFIFFLVPVIGTISSIASKNAKGGESNVSPRSWQNAVANAGIATISAALIAIDVWPSWHRILGAVIIANLTAALSDTLSHELGIMRGRAPRFILSLRTVPPGTNGAVSLFGSAVGIITALVFPSIAAALGMIQSSDILLASLSAIVGNAVDTIVGATVEARGWVGNNTVNFCCVLSATISLLILEAIRALI